MCRYLVLIMILGAALTAAPTLANTTPNPSPNDQIVIQKIRPDKRGGRAYRLIYTVAVPIDVLWRFKTDFDNDFLVSHKHIREHRFLSQMGNVAVTEDKYENSPDVFFKWQTTVFPQLHRLEFVLLNPEQCRQRFHYGRIQLQAMGAKTRVVHEAYFDFFGAALWAAYPWAGGMRAFLTDTARWEQQIVLENYK